MVRVSLNISCTFHYVPRDSKEQYNADCLARLGLALEQAGWWSSPYFSLLPASNLHSSHEIGYTGEICSYSGFRLLVMWISWISIISRTEYALYLCQDYGVATPLFHRSSRFKRLQQIVENGISIAGSCDSLANRYITSDQNLPLHSAILKWMVRVRGFITRG